MQGQWHKRRFWVYFAFFVLVHTAVFTYLGWNVPGGNAGALLWTAAEGIAACLVIAYLLGARKNFDEYVN